MLCIMYQQETQLSPKPEQRVILPESQWERGLPIRDPDPDAQYQSVEILAYCLLYDMPNANRLAQGALSATSRFIPLDRYLHTGNTRLCTRHNYRTATEHAICRACYNRLLYNQSW